jgi:K+/H+ antiporter YhaU regulatory subunit KhtT
VLLGATSPATGKRVAELDLASRSGASLLAVVRAGVPTPNPGADFRLAEGDRLLVLGTAEQLARLEGVLR